MIDYRGNKWCVIVQCVTKRHAQETMNNIDNGLRKLKIGKYATPGTYTIVTRKKK